MPYALRYREELDPAVQRELDDMSAWFNHQLSVALNEDGTLKAAAIPAANTQGGNEVDPTVTTPTPVAEGEEHWWKRGPWTFDDPTSSTPNVATCVTPNILGPANYNNFNPAGLDTAVILEVTPVTGTVTLTGLQRPVSGRRRLLVLRNTSTSISLILSNASALSQPTNRFNLPAGDLTIAPAQVVWLYWAKSGWQLAITAHTSGGLFGEGSTSLPSSITSIPSSVTNTLFTVKKTLTLAQLDALNATPVAMISAPGANKAIVPITYSIYSTRSGAWTTSSTGVLRYAGGAINLILTSPSFSLNVAGAGSRLTRGNGIQTTTITDTFLNTGIELTCAGDMNPGAQTGSAVVTIVYYIEDLS